MPSSVATHPRCPAQPQGLGPSGHRKSTLVKIRAGACKLILFLLFCSGVTRGRNGLPPSGARSGNRALRPFGVITTATGKGAFPSCKQVTDSPALTKWQGYVMS